MDKLYTEITTTEDFIAFKKNLHFQKVQEIAVDLEGEYNLHEYGERLCLIQIFDGSTYFLVDPFKIANVEIQGFFASKKPIKYFYGASSDKSLIYKQFGKEINSLYDIQYLAIALDYPHIGLDSMIHEILHVKMESKEKFQRFNWTKRPILEEAKQYALSDVEFLFDLQKVLLKQVIAKNKVQDVIFQCIRLPRRDQKPGVFRTQAFTRLNTAQKECFTQLYEVRERFARELNIPAAQIVSNMKLSTYAQSPGLFPRHTFNKKFTAAQRSRMIEEVKALSCN